MSKYEKKLQNLVSMVEDLTAKIEKLQAQKHLYELQIRDLQTKITKSESSDKLKSEESDQESV